MYEDQTHELESPASLGTGGAHGSLVSRRVRKTPREKPPNIDFRDIPMIRSSVHEKQAPFPVPSSSPRPTVRIVRLADLWRSSQPVPEKGDIEEWLADGVPAQWTDIESRAELERHAVEAPEVDLDAVKSAVPSRRVVMRRAVRDRAPGPRIPVGTPRSRGNAILVCRRSQAREELCHDRHGSLGIRGARLPMDDRPRDPASVIIMSAEYDVARCRVSGCGTSSRRCVRG